MINPSDLIKDVVEKLQAIPALQQFSIAGYDDESVRFRSQEEAIDNLNYLPILILWCGAEAPRSGEFRGFQHTIEIVVRGSNDPESYLLVASILNGKPQEPAGDGCLTFIESEPTGCDPISDITISRVRDADSIDYFRVSFIATEK